MTRPSTGIWETGSMESATLRDAMAAEEPVGKPRITREPSGGWLVTVPYGGARHLLYAFPSWRLAIAAVLDSDSSEAMKAAVERAWFAPFRLHLEAK